jgi:Holliday junction resolvase
MAVLREKGSRKMIIQLEGESDKEYQARCRKSQPEHTIYLSRNDVAHLTTLANQFGDDQTEGRILLELLYALSKGERVVLELDS